VLTVPADLDESALVGALLSGWDIDVRSMTYLAVAWGSHHWDVRAGNGARWFVTVDELENKRVSDDESVEHGLVRLRASLRSAVAPKNAGCEFVVAPVPARGGEPACLRRPAPARRVNGLGAPAGQRTRARRGRPRET
jgi:hypothetical protein